MKNFYVYTLQPRKRLSWYTISFVFCYSWHIAISASYETFILWHIQFLDPQKILGAKKVSSTQQNIV